jgi:hypothetical protein
MPSSSLDSSLFADRNCRRFVLITYENGAEYVTKLELEIAHLISEFSQDLQAAQVIFSLCSHVVNDVDEIPDT